MDFDGLSRDELIERLRVLAGGGQSSPVKSVPRDDRDRMLRELRLHQLELDAQNMAMRESQGALEESRSHYADLYDFAPVGYLTLSRSGVVVDINLTAAEMLGKERGELVGRPLLSATRGESRNEVSRHLRQCVRSAGPIVSELTLYTDRGPLEVQAVSTAMRDRGGGPPVYRTILMDIARLKQRERALSRANQAEAAMRRHLEVLDRAGVAITGALAGPPGGDLRGLLEIVVEQARTVAGAEYAAFGMVRAMGKPFEPWVMVGPQPGADPSVASPPRAVGLLAAVATSGKPIRVRDLRGHPSFWGCCGQTRTETSFLGVAIRQGDENLGNLYLVNKRGGQEFTEEDQLAIEMLAHRVAVVLELARRRRVQERERARLLVLTRAGRRLAEPMELQGTLQAISRVLVPDLADLCRVSVLRDGGAYRTVLATHRDPVKQKLLDRLMDRPPGEPLPEITRTALETGRPQLRTVGAQYPIERLAWDAAEREILEQVGVCHAIAAPLLRAGEPIGILTLMMAESGRILGEEDLALVEELAAEAVLALERSRLYQIAQDAIRARDGILALVSHDLKNPLAAIKLSAHSMLEHGLSGADETGQRQIAVIQGAASRMDRLIAELRDASTIEGGQLRMELNAEHGRELLEEAVQMVAPQVEAAAQRLELALRTDSTEILCDRQRVFQVVANLVDNAVKFTPTGGRIRIATETLGDMFHISVSDTGPGLRESEMERVFERYWRGLSGTQPGSGLGLYIARGIVHAHGGRIWAQNEAGGGTRFTFALPLAIAGDLTPAPVPLA